MAQVNKTVDEYIPTISRMIGRH